MMAISYDDNDNLIMMMMIRSCDQQVHSWPLIISTLRLFQEKFDGVCVPKCVRVCSSTYEQAAILCTSGNTSSEHRWPVGLKIKKGEIRCSRT